MSNTGAYRAGGKSGGGGGLKRLLLLLLGLLVLAALIFLAIQLLGGDDEKSAKGGGAGALTAGGAKLLPPPAEGLGPQAGKKASGKGLTVQSVNGNEGFFVGKPGKQRVYIEWGGDVGENEASRFKPKKGQKVTLTGPIQAADAKALGRLKLDTADRQLVKSQGGFVNADTVTATK